MKKFNHLFMPSILVAIFSFLLVLISSLIDYSWEEWRPATCMTTSIGCFCEKVGDGVVRQPINAWSSLAFAFLGVLVLCQAKKDMTALSKKNLLTIRYAYALTLGSSLIFIGLGSAFYHATLSFVGQTADVLGMYFFVNFIIVYNLSRIYPIKERHAALSFIFLNSLLAYFLIVYPELRRYIFALALITALYLEFKLRREKIIDIETKYLISAILIMLLSFIVWILDTYGIFCCPESLLQGHAVWHLGGAFAAWLIYLYYRSENACSDWKRFHNPG